MDVKSREMKKLIRSILNVHPDEITCGECYDVVDQYVEMELAGKNAQDAIPMVKDHLNRCDACREEYEALLTALKMMADQGGQEE
jgi:predicted anti-sigma-YlaC factor YlaD